MASGTRRGHLVVSLSGLFRKPEVRKPLLFQEEVSYSKLFETCKVAIRQRAAKILQVCNMFKKNSGASGWNSWLGDT